MSGDGEKMLMKPASRRYDLTWVYRGEKTLMLTIKRGPSGYNLANEVS